MTVIKWWKYFRVNFTLSPFRLTLSRCSLPPDVRVQMRKCLVKRKHWRSASFRSDSEPRRTLLSLPFSTEGSWIREPTGNTHTHTHQLFTERKENIKDSVSGREGSAVSSRKASLRDMMH